jgi:hypothetical protein
VLSTSTTGKFDELVYNVSLSNREKNSNLRQTRDLLLPRLVSGEIEVTS